jgi:hypothetical protein
MSHAISIMQFEKKFPVGIRKAGKYIIPESAHTIKYI